MTTTAATSPRFPAATTPIVLAAMLLSAVVLRTTACSARAAAAPTFQVKPVGAQFQSPVWVGSPAGTSRIFVVERRGVIKTIWHGKTKVFLDIRSRVGDNGGEQGLLSMEFDRNYVKNGRFWVLYAEKNGQYTHVDRWRGKRGHAIRGTRRTIIRIPVGPPAAQNHNGGMMDQMADGSLLISVGDGGDGGDPLNNAQNLSKLMGKILRISPRWRGGYAVPANNPFVGRSGARREIWALGLRNVWRFSIDPLTKDVWLADVGQDSTEEVNRIAGGTPGKYNFGWRRYEGPGVYDAGTSLTSGTTYVPPIFSYPHSQGCSITGGYVYRGSAIPAMQGDFLIADYCSSWIHGISPSGGHWKRDVGIGGISSFGVTSRGEQLFVSLDTGRAYRITP